MKRIPHIPDQQPDEQVVFVLHRFGATFSGRIASFVLFLVLPIAPIAIFWSPVQDILTSHALSGVLLVMGLSVYYFFLGVMEFHAWAVFMLDAWVATTKRIMNIEQKGLFSRVVSELPLDKIEDVTVEVHGLIPTILQYGDVRIQTAAEQEHFLFDNIPHPQDVARQIMQLHDQVQRRVTVNPVPSVPPMQNMPPQKNIPPPQK